MSSSKSSNPDTAYTRDGRKVTRDVHLEHDMTWSAQVWRLDADGYVVEVDRYFFYTRAEAFAAQFTDGIGDHSGRVR